MTDKQTQALILMLNAIRLQLFAANFRTECEELKECLIASATLAQDSMRLMELTSEGDYKG